MSKETNLNIIQSLMKELQLKFENNLVVNAKFLVEVFGKETLKEIIKDKALDWYKMKLESKTDLEEEICNRHLRRLSELAGIIYEKENK